MAQTVTCYGYPKSDHSVGYPIRNDRKIETNRPGIVIKHKKNKMF